MIMKTIIGVNNNLLLCRYTQQTIIKANKMIVVKSKKKRKKDP